MCIYICIYLFPNEVNLEMRILNAFGSVTSVLAGTELFALQWNLTAKRLCDTWEVSKGRDTSAVVVLLFKSLVRNMIAALKRIRVLTGTLNVAAWNYYVLRRAFQIKTSIAWKACYARQEVNRVIKNNTLKKVKEGGDTGMQILEKIRAPFSTLYFSYHIASSLHTSNFLYSRYLNLLLYLLRLYWFATN